WHYRVLHLRAREARTKTTDSKRLELRANPRRGRLNLTGIAPARWSQALRLRKSCRRESAADMDAAISIKAGRNPPSSRADIAVPGLESCSFASLLDRSRRYCSGSQCLVPHLPS